MRRKLIVYPILLAVLFLPYYWITLKAVFTDDPAANRLRKELSGSWRLVYPSLNKTVFINGETISFNRYLIFYEDRFLPFPYRVEKIHYQLGDKIIENQPAVVWSRDNRYSEWIGYGYAIVSISPDTLKLFPAFMIRQREKPVVYTFAKIKK